MSPLGEMVYWVMSKAISAMMAIDAQHLKELTKADLCHMDEEAVLLRRRAQELQERIKRELAKRE